ncbi:MAG TPA: LamG domain-containing protein, partial [Bacillota bacterium]|nr:LamG domain-containing protein [Bacillota bacterium]
MQDADVVAALNAATTAEAIADGRIVTHRGSAPPLVGHWKLNDNAASTTVVDATGNGHDGVASANTDTLTTTGKINAGFNFGGSDYVLVADHADFSAMTAGSWCAWFKTTHTNQHMLLTKFGSGYEWYLYQLATGTIGLRVFSSSTTAIYLDIQTTAAFNDGSWHHVVAVWDGSLTPAGLFLYIDGEEVAVTRSSAGTFVSVPDTGEDVWIGALGNNTQNWNGQLDDVRIYSRALTYGEALKLYNRGGGTEEVKVPDRGDLWIKTSEDNKPYQWTGSAWQAAGYDVATWAKIVGTGKPDDYADVTADSPILTFRETFENTNNDYLDKWSIASKDESNAIIVAEEGVAGGKVLQIGDNSGVDDTVNIRYHKKFAYDPTKLYRLRIRVKRTAGTGVLYFGVCAYTSALAANNPTGYTAHWVTAYNDNPDSDWEVFTGYFSGLSASANGRPSSDPASPAPLKDGTAYFDFFGHINYGSGGAQGIYKIDEIVLDILPEDADQIAEGGTHKFAAESGADVTAV